MAIIYTYPELTSPQGGDLLLISDVSVQNNPTNRITLDNVATYVTARVNLNFLGDTGTGIVNLDTQNLTISGTANEIETAASSQTLQIGLPDNVTITNDLTVNNDTSISGSLSVLNTLTVSDNRIPKARPVEWRYPLFSGQQTRRQKVTWEILCSKVRAVLRITNSTSCGSLTASKCFVSFLLNPFRDVRGEPIRKRPPSHCRRGVKQSSQL